MHLLSGDVEPWEPPASPGTSVEESTVADERIERLENEVATLRKELAEVKQQVEDLLKN